MTTFVDSTTLITAAFLNAVAAVIEDDAVSSLAAVTPAADKLPYYTGAAAAAVTDFSAFGRTLVDDADASTARTTLGLAIGTNVQAYDAELAALAGLTSAANKVPYFTGSGTAAVADFSVAGRALVDDADAAAQLTTLGITAFIQTVLDDATAAAARTTLGALGQGEAAIYFAAITDDTTSGASKTISFAAAREHTISMTGNCTFTFTAPTGPCTVFLTMIQDGTGSRTMTLPASVKWPGSYSAAEKLLSTAASKRDLLILHWNGTDYVANLIKAIA